MRLWLPGQPVFLALGYTRSIFLFGFVMGGAYEYICSAVRTKTVRNAPLNPTAPPMTPVARPFRPLYHFWAQDWMDG